MLQSTGDVAEYQGHRLGVFLPAGEHDGKPSFRQKDTLHGHGLGSDVELYWSSSQYAWLVGSMSDGAVGLRNLLDTEIPTSLSKVTSSTSNYWLNS